MRKIISAILTFSLALLFVQCDTVESRKKKAEGLIKQDLFETLPDYKSYELVSIEMDTIKNKWVSIPGIIELAKEYQSALTAEYAANATVFNLQKELTEYKSDDFVGWDVTHKFRANNDSGVSQLYCYHYYISPDMKQIILKWADDDESIPQLLNLIDSVLDTINNGETSPNKGTTRTEDENLEGIAAVAVYDNGKKLHFKSDKTIVEIPWAAWEMIENALVYYNGEQYMSIIDGYVYEGEYHNGKCWREEWNAADECLDDVGYIPTQDNGRKLKSFEWIK